MDIIKCVIGFLVFFFGFYMYLDDSRRGIKYNLSKEEKRYFDIIETWFYISVMTIFGQMTYPLYEYFN